MRQPRLPRDVRARRDRIAPACGTATAEAAVAAARAGDARALAGLAEIGRCLGIGIANMITVISPDRVVIGGGVAAAGDLLLDPIRAEVARRVQMTSVDDGRDRDGRARDVGRRHRRGDPRRRAAAIGGAVTDADRMRTRSSAGASSWRTGWSRGSMPIEDGRDRRGRHRRRDGRAPAGRLPYRRSRASSTSTSTGWRPRRDGRSRGTRRDGPRPPSPRRDVLPADGRDRAARRPSRTSPNASGPGSPTHRPTAPATGVQPRGPVPRRRAPRRPRSDAPANARPTSRRRPRRRSSTASG